jgi:hypothetical protein
MPREGASAFFIWRCLEVEEQLPLSDLRLLAEGVSAWPPRSFGRSIWAGDHYDITVRVPHPALPVIRAAVPIGRVLMPRQDNLHTHFHGALHDCIKVVYFEPQQYPVAIWLVVTIGNRAVMVFDFEAMQLKDEPAVRDQLLVGRAPMIAPATQQTLIPPTACFHIRDGN